VFFASQFTAAITQSNVGVLLAVKGASLLASWQLPQQSTMVAVILLTATVNLLIGSASADLWISADATDTDLEVTISEIRPDGNEMYVQSGWLRASHRALDDSSTELRVVQTHLESDVEPLVPGEPVLARVDIFPFAHAFRAGSQLRITIDAPGGNRGVWSFRSISAGEKVTVLHDAEHPSSIVLPVIPGVSVPAGLPACGSLRGQPCRPV